MVAQPQSRGLHMYASTKGGPCCRSRTPPGAGAGCGQVNVLIEDHIAQVTAHIGELTRLARMRQALRTRGSRPGEAAQCGILGALQRPRSGIRPCGA